jgi:hypothetical protein
MRYNQARLHHEELDAEAEFDWYSAYVPDIPRRAHAESRAAKKEVSARAHRGTSRRGRFR